MKNVPRRTVPRQAYPWSLPRDPLEVTEELRLRVRRHEPDQEIDELLRGERWREEDRDE